MTKSDKITLYAMIGIGGAMLFQYLRNRIKYTPKRRWSDAQQIDTFDKTKLDVVNDAKDGSDIVNKII